MQNAELKIPVVMLFVSGIFSSCVRNESTYKAALELPSINSTSITEFRSDSNKLQLDTFSNTPPDTIHGGYIIDGCGGYFSTDSISYSKGELILASDLNDIAIIKVKNHYVYLNRSDNAVREFDKEFNATYFGEGFTVIIKSHMKRVEGEEYSIYEGTLEVTKDKLKLSQKIFGGIGC